MAPSPKPSSTSGMSSVLSPMGWCQKSSFATYQQVREDLRFVKWLGEGSLGIVALVEPRQKAGELPDEERRFAIKFQVWHLLIRA